MTELIVCLGSGKGTWAHLARLVSSEEWDKVYLVCDKFYTGKFTTINREHEYISIDINKPIRELARELLAELTGKVRGTEIAINLVSGTGKEHMAIISAVLKLGVGLRFVAFIGAKAEEI